MPNYVLVKPEYRCGEFHGLPLLADGGLERRKEFPILIVVRVGVLSQVILRCEADSDILPLFLRSDTCA